MYEQLSIVFLHSTIRGSKVAEKNPPVAIFVRRPLLGMASMCQTVTNVNEELEEVDLSLK